MCKWKHPNTNPPPQNCMIGQRMITQILKKIYDIKYQLMLFEQKNDSKS